MKEHALQVSVAHMLHVVLDPERTWWTALDHAAKLSPVYGAQRKRRGVKPGLPDFLILYKPPPRRVAPGRVAVNDIRILGIELKTDKGRLNDAQHEVADAWSALGGALVYVARSLEEVQEILDHCDVPMRTRMTIFPQVPHELTRRPTTARHKRPRRRGQ